MYSYPQKSLGRRHLSEQLQKGFLLLPLMESSTAVSCKWCSLIDFSVHRAHIPFFSQGAASVGFRDRLLLLLDALSCISSLASQSQLLCESEVMCRTSHSQTCHLTNTLCLLVQLYGVKSRDFCLMFECQTKLCCDFS